ncbi:MAG: isochorismatase family protein [Gemmatimonadales bacterium]|nr:MAG: isochorismatase family protein [Gemmatimonadales bacterium]
MIPADRTVFWDVDTQYDFMMSDGKLYVPGSEEIIPVLGALTDHAHDHGIRILASADDHVPGHRELSEEPDFLTTFPEHCMRGTPGQEKIAATTLRNPLVIDPTPREDPGFPDTVRIHDGDILFLKYWFDVFTNPNVLPALDALDLQRVVLYGVATDVCDRYAMEGLLRHRPGLTLYFVCDAARGIDADASDRLRREWKAQGVRMVTAQEVLTR